MVDSRTKTNRTKRTSLTDQIAILNPRLPNCNAAAQSNKGQDNGFPKLITVFLGHVSPRHHPPCPLLLEQKCWVTSTSPSSAQSYCHAALERASTIFPSLRVHEHRSLPRGHHCRQMNQTRDPRQWRRSRSLYCFPRDLRSDGEYAKR